MENRKSKLLERIEADRDILVDFLRQFIRCRSPNPPGDTREAATHILKLLDQRNVAYRVIAPQETMPNIVATLAGGKPGRHLALNGHIDVFPVGEGVGWTQDPWGGRAD
jgi:succinyl-diaminopimelate desuccinylase